VKGVDFRAMIEGDLPEVVAIERSLFSDPWPEEMFLRDLEGGGRGHAVVGVEEGVLVCYGMAWCVGREFHIANMAVRRDRQGVGIGSFLLDAMLAEALRQRCTVATLEVRMSNARAIALYRSRRFREVAIRKSYYTDNGEDALVMLRELAAEGGAKGGLV